MNDASPKTGRYYAGRKATAPAGPNADSDYNGVHQDGQKSGDEARHHPLVPYFEKVRSTASA